MDGYIRIIIIIIIMKYGGIIRVRRGRGRFGSVGYSWIQRAEDAE